MMAQMSDRAILSRRSVCALCGPNARKLTRSRVMAHLEEAEVSQVVARTGLSARQHSLKASKAEE